MSRIKDLRQAHGMTQEELGKKLNLQKAAISKYEKGTVIPNGDVLKRLSAIFNVSTDYLLDNEIERSEKFSDDETKLIQNYRWLNENDKNLIVSMISRLSGSTHSNNRMHKSENGSNYGVVDGNFSPNVTIV